MVGGAGVSVQRMMCVVREHFEHDRQTLDVVNERPTHRHPELHRHHSSNIASLSILFN